MSTKTKLTDEEDLAEIVLNSVEPGYPVVHSLSPEQKRSIALMAKAKLTAEYKGHQDIPEAFKAGQDVKDLIRTEAARLCGEGTPLQQEAIKFANRLIHNWTVFIKNARLFKLARVSAETFSKGMAQ